MNRVQNLTQAYSQAPWRKQLSMIGLFLLMVVFVGLVAGIYLNVTARADTVGREIQVLNGKIEQVERDKADLQAKLAYITSTGEMEKRARDLGFEPIGLDESVYLTVNGYTERRPASLAPAGRHEVVGAPVLPAEYTETIFEWLRKQSFNGSFDLFEVVP